MTNGCVRAWALEEQKVTAGELRTRHQRALYRRDFETTFRRTAGDVGDKIKELQWGQHLELIDWPSGNDWTKVRIGIEEGFVKTSHLVEVAYIKKTSGKNKYTAKLLTEDGQKQDLLWCDYINVVERGETTCKVRARGSTGTLPTNRLMSEPLLEVYFIDDGQGDGVLVRTPDGRHMLIDGGLPRNNQLTGKNAADFVDWKLFFDYGDYKIHIDAMIASHSDYDHYGGLWDLMWQEDTEEDRTRFASNKILLSARRQDTKVNYHKQLLFVSLCICGDSIRFIRVGYL